MRGIAVLLVIIHHYPYFELGHRFGWTGVDLFFVLSGFLVSGLLFKELRETGTFSIWRFLGRRAFKIYPAFYAFLLAMAPFMMRASGARPFFAEAAFLQNYLPRVFGHTWSLAVEEHFYLFLPLLLLLLKRKGRLSLIPIFSVALAFLCLILRFTAARSANSIESILFPSHLRVDSLFAGVALGYLFHFGRDQFLRASKWWLPFVALPLLLPAAVVGERISTLPWVLTCNVIGYALIVLWSVPRSAIRCVVLERIGAYSYSIYLWHLFVTAIWRQENLTFFSFLANLVSCIIVGICAATVIELPILKLREKLLPRERRSERIAVAAGPDARPSIGRITPIPIS